MPLKIVQLDDKEELVQLVRNNCTMIDKGVEILGGPLGTEDLPRIDLVAKEKNGRPLLILAGVRPDENALLNAAAQIDWFVRNRSLLRQLFQDLSIDNSAPPRAALIYPEFPLIMKRFVRAALPQPPLLYQYRCLQVHEERFLYLERFDPDSGEERLSVRQENLPRFRSGISGEEVEITSEEREAFLS
jgi:hypothetical protein